MTDISREAVDRAASVLTRKGELYRMANGTTGMTPQDNMAAMILALRAALDRAEAELNSVLTREAETTRRYDERLDRAEAAKAEAVRAEKAEAPTGGVLSIIGGMEIDGVNRVGAFIACDVQTVRGLGAMLGEKVSIRAGGEG